MKFAMVGMLAALLSFAPALGQDEDNGPTPAEAAELVAKPIPAPASGGAALTATDVEAFSDGFFPPAIATGDVAGVVIVVVKDGQVLFQKGYGVSDVKTRAPVDPAATLFRPGSISKLFVWTSIMQLVGEGKLDLDTDINRYLDFTIPPAFGRPITLRNLMTHTPGFEESYRPLLIGNPDTVEPLGKVVKDAVPARVFPPGEVPAYSNYGATLAGYIVQRVSGEPFASYVQRHIFGPLAMTHSTFAQPLPASLRAAMATGYQTASGPATPFEMLNYGPAGGLSASGGDIARFMIAHLNSGAYGTARILSPELAVRMHGTAFRPFPDLPPMAYGFYHEDMNGHVLIGHDGDTGVFHSLLSLILDSNTGIFISANSAGIAAAAPRMRYAYLLAFMNRYFPAPRAAVLPTARTAHADGLTIAGTYIASRGGQTNFTRLFALAPLTVSLNADDTVTVSGLVNPAGQPRKWREVGPYLWHEVNGNFSLEAKVRDGRVEQLGSDQIGPIIVFLPAPAWTGGLWNALLLVVTAAILLLTVIFWPIKAILRRRYQRPLALGPRERVLYTLSRVVALLDLIFLGGFPLLFIYASLHLATLSPASDVVIRVLQILGVIGVVGTVVPVLNFAAGVRDAARPWWTKATDLLLALAALATVWIAFTQHLLTLGLKY